MVVIYTMLSNLHRTNIHTYVCVCVQLYYISKYMYSGGYYVGGRLLCGRVNKTYTKVRERRELNSFYGTTV